MDDCSWDDDEFEVAAVQKVAAVKKTTGFDSEEESDDETSKVQGSQPKKKDKKKLYKEELLGASGATDGASLDDPLAEKLRKQRLVEEADFELAKECFGEDTIDLDKFIPKTSAEFEKYATLLAMKYLRPYSSSSHYTTMLRTVMRKGMVSLNSSDAKDLETAIGVIRNEKVKAEKPAAKSKKALKKATLNTRGDGGGDLMAMEEDAQYRNEVLDDDYDFM